MAGNGAVAAMGALNREAEFRNVALQITKRVGSRAEP